MELVSFLTTLAAFFVVYFLASLVFTMIQIAISSGFQWREVHLKRFLHTVVMGKIPTRKRDAPDFVDRLYEHATIRLIYQRPQSLLSRSYQGLFRLIDQSINRVFRRRPLFLQPGAHPNHLPPEKLAAATVNLLQLEAAIQIQQDQSLATRLEALQTNLTEFCQGLWSAATVADKPDVAIVREPMQVNFNELERLRKDFSRGQISAEKLTALMEQLTGEMLTYLAETIDSLFQEKGLAELWRYRLNMLRSQISLSHYQEPNISQVLEQISLPGQLPQIMKPLADIVNPDQSLHQEGEALQSHLSGWFTDVAHYEQRAYERQLRARSLVLGVILAGVINLDTMAAAAFLYQTPILVKTQTIITEQLQSSETGLQESVGELSERIQELLVPLPVGHSEQFLARQQELQARWFIPLVSSRHVGWLISGAAISLGAPFWMKQIAKMKEIVDLVR